MVSCLLVRDLLSLSTSAKLESCALIASVAAVPGLSAPFAFAVLFSNEFVLCASAVPVLELSAPSRFALPMLSYLALSPFAVLMLQLSILLPLVMLLLYLSVLFEFAVHVPLLSSIFLISLSLWTFTHYLRKKRSGLCD